MLFFPVDVFTPYIQGREYAIDRNWNDLNQYNTVTQGRLKSERDALGNLFAQTTFGDQVSKVNSGARLSQNQAAASDMQLGLDTASYGGRLSLAGAQGATQEAQAAAILNNLPQYAGAIDSRTQSDLGLFNARTSAQNQYGAPVVRANAQNNYDNARLTGQQIAAQSQLLPAQVSAQEALLAGQANQYTQNPNDPYASLGTFGTATPTAQTPANVAVDNSRTSSSLTAVNNLRPGQAMENPFNPTGGDYPYIAKSGQGYLYAYSSLDANGNPVGIIWITGPYATGN